MAKTPKYNLENKPVATWLSPDESARLTAIAKAHGVTTAAFLRAIIVDILAEEKATYSAYKSPSGTIAYCAHLKV